MSRAILALYAAQKPLDWKYTDRPVLAENVFFTTDKLNLHHIFPTNFLANQPGKDTIDHNLSIIHISEPTRTY